MPHGCISSHVLAFFLLAIQFFASIHSTEALSLTPGQRGWNQTRSSSDSSTTSTTTESKPKIDSCKERGYKKGSDACHYLNVWDNLTRADSDDEIAEAVGELKGKRCSSLSSAWNYKNKRIKTVALEDTFPTNITSALKVDVFPSRNPFNCCRRCKVYWNGVSVMYWPHPQAQTACLSDIKDPSVTNIPLQHLPGQGDVEKRDGNVSTTVISGTTFTSPYIYIQVPILTAFDPCTALTPSFSNFFTSFLPERISSIEPNYVGCWYLYWWQQEFPSYGGVPLIDAENPVNYYPQGLREMPGRCKFSTKPFNFADLPCPPQTLRDKHNEGFLYNPDFPYLPILAPLYELRSVVPEWEGCEVPYGWDPYSALQPFGELLTPSTEPVHVPAQTTSATTPTSVGADPSPHITSPQDALKTTDTAQQDVPNRSKSRLREHGQASETFKDQTTPSLTPDDNDSGGRLVPNGGQVDAADSSDQTGERQSISNQQTHQQAHQQADPTADQDAGQVANQGGYQGADRGADQVGDQVADHGEDQSEGDDLSGNSDASQSRDFSASVVHSSTTVPDGADTVSPGTRQGHSEDATVVEGSTALAGRPGPSGEGSSNDLGEIIWNAIGGSESLSPGQSDQTSTIEVGGNHTPANTEQFKPANGSDIVAVSAASRARRTLEVGVGAVVVAALARVMT